MKKPQQHQVELTEEEREFLIRNTKSGKWTAREVKRAQILLRTDRNKEAKKDAEIAKELNCHFLTVRNLRHRFQEQRLNAIYDRARSGRPKIIDGDIEAHIVAVACSKAPEGRERWTLRLLADKVVSLTDLDECSYGTIRNTLKKIDLSLG